MQYLHIQAKLPFFSVQQLFCRHCILAIHGRVLFNDYLPLILRSGLDTQNLPIVLRSGLNSRNQLQDIFVKCSRNLLNLLIQK